MRIRFRQCLAFLVVCLLGLVAKLSAAEFTAKWVGQTDGGWSDPANWDIGQVPNNTTTDTYDVIWDSRPVTVRLGSDITIRNFTFASGGVITELNVRFNFTIEGAFEWTHGTIAVSGQTIVKGPARLEGGTTDSLILDAGVLLFKGHTDLYSNLQWLNNDKIVNDVGAVFEAHDGASMVRKANRTFVRIENHGKFRILAGATTFPCVQIVNTGSVEVGARTVEFQTGSFTDILQQEGELSLDNAIIKGKVTVEDPGKLQGGGYVREGEAFDGGITGRLTFDLLTLGAEATTTLALSGRVDGSYDRLSVDRNLELSGKLEVRLANGLAPEPGDVFEIVTAAGGISGRFNDDRFNPINFGTRIPVTGGDGSFLLEQTTDLKSVVLRDFVGGPFTLGPGAMGYRLPSSDESLPGCFVAPSASLNLADGNWAGGNLKVEIKSGFDPDTDQLEFRENPALPPGEFVLSAPSNGEQTFSFRGTNVGTVRLAGSQMTCDLNADTRNEAIISLLGHLHYENTNATAGWFKQALDRFPPRTFAVTLTDSAAAQRQITQDVQFPYLIGLEFSDSLVLKTEEADFSLDVLGRFSNSQRIETLNLATEWSKDCDDLKYTTSPSPGIQNFTFQTIMAACVITAKAEPFQASILALRGNCIMFLFAGIILPNPLRVAATAIGGNAPISLATFYALQSLMNETAEGRRLANLYGQHTAEVAQIVFANPGLRDQAIDVVRTFQPGVSALLSGKGQGITITQPMIDQLKAVWNGIANLASPALRAVLVQEQARFDGFQQFVNKGFSQWAALLDFPAPEQPWLHISGTKKIEGRFSLEANDVPGTDFSLWRSFNFNLWELVPNADVQRKDFTLYLADPSPPAEKAFYQIRR